MVREIPEESLNSERVHRQDRGDVASGASLHPREKVLGRHIVVISEAERLGPQAYSADNAGIEPFQCHQNSHRWVATKCYEGYLEGRVQNQPVGNLYLVCCFSNDDVWIRRIEANWKSMQDTIREERAELKTKMYQRSFEIQFQQLLKQIEIERGRLEELVQRKDSVLTSASDDFMAGASGEKETDEKSPSDFLDPEAGSNS